MGLDLTMTSPAYAAGQYGNALTGGYGKGGQLSSANNAFTIEAVVSSTASALVVAEGQIKVGWFGHDANGYALAHYGNDNEVSLQTNIKINDGARHRVRLVAGPNGGKLYVDGALGASSTTSLAAAGPNWTSNYFYIRHFEVPNYEWTGSVDEHSDWSTEYTSNLSPTAAYAGSEGMAHLYHFDGNGTDSAGAAALSLIPRTNSALFFAPFVWNDDGAAANATTGHAYVKGQVTGTTVGLRVGALTGLSYFPVVRVFVDNLPSVDVQLTDSKTDYVAFSGLAAGTHTWRIALVKINEFDSVWALGNALKLVGLLVDSGATVSAPAVLRSKRAIWFGDSIPNGIRADGQSPAYPTGMDSLASFVGPIMEALDCEYGAVCYGGQGYEQQGSGSVPAFPSAYNLYSQGVSRLVGGVLSPAPDYLIDSHGTNGTTTQADVAAALQFERTIAPNATIFKLVPPGGFARTAITAAVNAAIASGDTKIVLIDLGGGAYQAGLDGKNGVVDLSGTSEQACDTVHPWRRTHARLAAGFLALMRHAIEPRRFTIAAN